ncbi:hypothetical protein [Phaeobacter sp. HF9A]|uniref:hypothetical protein n=1 Tax=Phaeobacter sp. HF9A TaxID=2721561 RepID=UPI0014303963|nr:hypothetical protein [Phaeobacter sp. HF9A]NIZ11829.1 hypothetical protein [Phaeobacter sp. HF9A]
MNGWDLLKHAAYMLLRNLGDVLRIFLVPTLVAVAGIYCLAQVLGVYDVFVDATAGRPPRNPGSFIGSALLIIVFFFLVYTWPIVAWHRYVLLEEPVSGFVPEIKADRIIGYIGQAFLLSLLLLLLMIPVGVVISIVLRMAGAQIVGLMPIIGPGLAILPTWVFMRLSVSLPSVALGNKMRLGDIWSATSGGAVLGLTVLVMILQAALEFSYGLLPGIAGTVWWLVGTTVFSLLQISIVTTLYGYYIEKRPI